jgi:hypothetical protein
VLTHAVVQEDVEATRLSSAQLEVSMSSCHNCHS